MTPAFLEALEMRVLMVAPGTPTSPTPTTSLTANPMPITFTWSATTNTTNYDVYLDGALQTNVTTNSWNHGALTQGNHNWQVVSKNATESTTGSLWTFTLSRPTGVDVSTFQGTMNWTTALNKGIDFAFIRGSRTDTLPDPQLANNMNASTGAKAKGILVGVYHRALPFGNTDDIRGTNDANYVEPETDAQNYFNYAGAYMGSGFLRPVVDVEDGSVLNTTPHVNANSTTTNLSQWVTRWVTKFKTLNGNITPTIYTGNYRTYLDSTVVAALPNLWIANWEMVSYGDPVTGTGGPPTSASPGWTPSPNFKFWQYDSPNGLGSQYGAQSVDIDLDVYNGSDINLLKTNFMIGAPTALPGTPAPANAATNVVTSTLDWSDAPGTAVYDVYLDNMITPAATGLTSSVWTITPSLSQGNHTWRVVAKGNTSDDDTWVNSPTWKFAAANASAAPTGTPDLSATNDSGMSDTDNRTNFNNSSPAKALTFTITGTLPGTTLKLYANTTLIKTMPVTSTTTIVTTDGAPTLPGIQGGYAITATQTESGKLESAASPSLQVIIDTFGPPAPTTITAVPSGAAIFVDWNNAPGSVTDVWGYNIYRSTTSGGPYTLLNGTPLAASDYTDSAVTPGQTYYYVACGIDTAGNEPSPRSAQVSATAASATSATPGTPDLDAGTDTGTLDTDNITKRNNSSGNALQFLVGSTIASATIKIYADGNLIGSAVASGATTTVITDPGVLSDGVHSITARMTESGKNESPASVALSVTIDTAAPSADIVDVLPDPRSGGVSSIGINFNESVSGFDRVDLNLRRDGGSDLLSASQSLSSGNNISFTLNTLSTITHPTGSYVLALPYLGSGITDVAGNALAADSSDAFGVRVISGDATANAHDVFRIEPAGGSLVKIFVNNNTAVPDYTWDIPADQLLRIFGLGGNDTLTVYGPLGADVSFDGGTQSGGGEDSMLVIGNGATTGSYTPGATTGAGTIAFSGDSLQFENLEPIGVNNFASFSLITPSALDAITIDSPSAGTNRISGTSGGVAFESLHITDVAAFTLDSGANDGAGADDTVTIDSSGIVATSNFAFVGGAGSDTLSVNGGTLSFNADASSTTAQLTLNVGATATVNFNATQHLKALNLNSGAATLVAGGSKVLLVDSITTTGTGALNLADNDLIVKAMSFDDVKTLVKAGYGNFNWQGTGINSATAAATSGRMLGVVDNLNSGYTTFSGHSVTSTDILVKYTYLGDATVDGLVTPDDFTLFVTGISGGPSKAKWGFGDFDYNGFVNPDDFTSFVTGLGAFNANAGTQL